MGKRRVFEQVERCGGGAVVVRLVTGVRWLVPGVLLFLSGLLGLPVPPREHSYK